MAATIMSVAAVHRAIIVPPPVPVLLPATLACRARNGSVVPLVLVPGAAHGIDNRLKQIIERGSLTLLYQHLGGHSRLKHLRADAIKLPLRHLDPRQVIGSAAARVRDPVRRYIAQAPGQHRGRALLEGSEADIGFHSRHRVIDIGRLDLGLDDESFGIGHDLENGFTGLDHTANGMGVESHNRARYGCAYLDMIERAFCDGQSLLQVGDLRLYITDLLDDVLPERTFRLQHLQSRTADHDLRAGDLRNAFAAATEQPRGFSLQRQHLGFWRYSFCQKLAKPF